MRGKGNPSQNTDKQAPMRQSTVRDRFSFHAKVETNSDGDVTILLKELGVYGRGQTLAQAQADLVEDVREYLAQYDRDETLHNAPNRQGHILMVKLAQAADQRGKLSQVLFANMQEA